ncbi:TPA: hypothetical protein ACH3X2_010728 [Trebouxia sp. C0005]
MAFLVVCAALLAALPVSPATASSLQDVFKLYQNGVEAHTSARKLQQDSSVCGFNEYFCGDTDMISDTAYNAVVAGNCFNDTVDTGTFYCGDESQPVIISAATYNTISVNKNSCPVDCSNSAASSNSTTFYWQVAAWSSCSVACNGGFQTRDVVCHSALDGSQVSNGNCDQGSKPLTRLPCNQVPCAVSDPGLTLGFTAWGECGVQCGSGFSQRTAYCINPYGALADLSMCSNYSGTQLSRTCTAASCSGSTWQVGDWSECSVKCNGGVSNRTVQCADVDENPVSSGECAGQMIPASGMTCNTVPCVGYVWQVGAWEACTESCGSGTKNRTVSCVEHDGTVVADHYCAGLKPEHQAYCNDYPCDFCSTTDCSSEGTCRNDLCVCTPGYSGTYCEVPPACGVILDVNGNCCNHGVVSSAGVCCGSKAVLDRDANCCESGKLDACGACDGTGLLIDVQNVCCNSTVLDAGGYCCASGLLDDCGVCDGDGSSCALHVVVTTQVTQESLFLTLTDGNVFADTLASFAAGILGVNLSYIEVTDLTLDPGTTITSQNQASITMRADFLVTPADSFSGSMDLSAALATRNLQDSVGSSGTNQVFILQSADLVERQAVCGNLVCEAGERPSSADGSNGGCAEDCLMILDQCPIPAGGTLCSGVGWCLSTQGICQCYLGYAGDDCSSCDEGYVRTTTGGACIRNIKAALPNIDRSGSASLYAVLAIGIALAALGGIFMCITIIIIYKWRKDKKGGKLRRRSSKQTLLLSPDQDDMSEDGGSKSRSESMLDVARGLSASLQNIRREFSGQSATSPQRSAHSLGGLPVGGLAVGRGAQARGDRGLSSTKASGLSSSKKRGDAMRRAAASRFADRKDDAASVYVPATEVTQKPSLQKTSSSRRSTGDADHSSKAAHFLLKNPKASVSMLRRSPSDQKRVSGDVEFGPSPTQGEVGASPFEYNQGRFSNEPILAGNESPTRNPLLRIPETFESLASASSGELSTTSSRALLGNCKGSS